MSLHLRNIVIRQMDAVAMSYIRSSFDDYEGARVMVVSCESSNKPIYVTDGNDEKFYIRTGPSTTELSTSETVSYISDRF